MTTETRTERQAFTDLSDQELTAALALLRQSDLELRNRRSHEGTLGDTLATYDLLRDAARKLVADGLRDQAHELKRTRGTAVWHLPPAFANALWVLEDAEGGKRLLKAIEAQEYGLVLEEYEKEHRAKLTSVAEIEGELAGRELRRRQAELDRQHAARMAQIGGRQ